MMQRNWAHIQSFAAVIEQGSLSTAGRALHNSQPTLGRHIATLESRIGARLFELNRGGMKLTKAGSKLMAYASQMADAAVRISAVGSGQNVEQGDTLRITVCQLVASFLRPLRWLDCARRIQT